MTSRTGSTPATTTCGRHGTWPLSATRTSISYTTRRAAGSDQANFTT
ncbi:hypothetical protein [Catellatospora sp. NPDC049609]